MRLILLLVPALFATAVQAQEDPSKAAEALYVQRCASCHDSGVARAPLRDVLAKLPAETIRFAITSGSMSTTAAGLSDAQRESLVTFLAQPASPQQASTVDSSCPAEAKPYAASLSAPHWNGWGAGVTQQRFQPADQARLAPDQVPRLKLKWAFGFPGAKTANSQPTIVDGRLFVGSAGFRVYSLNAATGCTYWSYKTEFPVRTAITVGPSGNTTAAYFGDQHGTAYAVDALTGKLLWKLRVDDHIVAMITGAPTLAEGVLYVPVASLEDAIGADPKYQCCKFRGSVSAIDAATGKVLWKGSTIPEPLEPLAKNKQGVQLWGPSGAGVWSSPTVDLKRQRVYVTTSNSTSDPPAATSDAFVAFDMKTGAIAWSRQGTSGDGYNLSCDLPSPYNANCPSANGPDFDFGSSAILLELRGGHRALIAGQKSGVVHAIDPDADGKVLWQKAVGRGGKIGGVQWGSASDGKNVYVALSDALLRAVDAKTAGAQPALGAYFAFDPKIGGGIFALDAATGETRWHTPHPGCNDKPGCSPGQSAAVTAIPGIVFSGGIDGHMRAYASSDGKIVWDYDTMQDFATVNGVTAQGGSLNGPGAVVVGGMLYMNSGYVHMGTAPGNVLLAFSVDGK